MSSRYALVVVVGLAVLGLPFVAAARPVPIGHFRTLRYGVNPNHPWPALGGSGARRYRARGHVSATAPRLVWSRNSGIGRVFEPLVAADGRVLLSGNEGALALDVDNLVHWTYHGPLSSGAPALLPSGAVVVLQRHGVAITFDATAQMERSVSESGLLYTPLALPDGSVVAATGAHELLRFDPETGEVRYRSRVAEGVRGGARAIGGDRVVVPTTRGVAFVDGEGRVSSLELGGRGAPTLGPTVLDSGLIAVVLADGRYVRISRSGELHSERALPLRPSGASNLAQANDGSLRFAAADGTLVALAPDGDPVFSTGGRFLHGVTVDAAGVTLTVDAAGELVAVDPRGAELWRVPVQGRAVLAPVVDPEGRIYVGTVAGRIFCYRTDS